MLKTADEPLAARTPLSSAASIVVTLATFRVGLGHLGHLPAISTASTKNYAQT